MSLPPTVYRGPTPPDLAAIPEELKRWQQWILWRGEAKGEQKINKIPVTRGRYATPAPQHPPHGRRSSTALQPCLFSSNSWSRTILRAFVAVESVSRSAQQTPSLASIWTDAVILTAGRLLPGPKRSLMPWAATAKSARASPAYMFCVRVLTPEWQPQRRDRDV